MFLIKWLMGVKYFSTITRHCVALRPNFYCHPVVLMEHAVWCLKGKSTHGCHSRCCIFEEYKARCEFYALIWICRGAFSLRRVSGCTVWTHGKFIPLIMNPAFVPQQTKSSFRKFVQYVYLFIYKLNVKTNISYYIFVINTTCELLFKAPTFIRHIVNIH